MVSEYLTSWTSMTRSCLYRLAFLLQPGNSLKNLNCAFIVKSDAMEAPTSIEEHPYIPLNCWMQCDDCQPTCTPEPSWSKIFYTCLNSLFLYYRNYVFDAYFGFPQWFRLVVYKQHCGTRGCCQIGHLVSMHNHPQQCTVGSRW